MSFECFTTCLNKVPVEVAVDFSGMSEAWKNPECTRMVQYASGRGHRVRIHTTLTGMRKEDVEMLSALPLDAFRVHLPSSNNLEKIVVDVKYLEVLEKVASLIPAARFVCFGRRAHPAVKQLLKKYPAAKIRMASASNRADNACSEGKPVFYMKKGAMQCSNNARYNILLPNGDVILCCMDYGLKNVLGNLLSMDYNELFQGPEFRKICAGFKDPLFGDALQVVHGIRVSREYPCQYILPGPALAVQLSSPAFMAAVRSLGEKKFTAVCAVSEKIPMTEYIREMPCPLSQKTKTLFP